jgi:hypothetical protein
MKKKLMSSSMLSVKQPQMEMVCDQAASVVGSDANSHSHSNGIMNMGEVECDVKGERLEEEGKKVGKKEGKVGSDDMFGIADILMSVKNSSPSIKDQNQTQTREASKTFETCEDARVEGGFISLLLSPSLPFSLFSVSLYLLYLFISFPI